MNQKINIGKSGLSAPFLGLGTWAIGGGSWWGDNDDALSVKAIETAVEQGIVWVDTAPIYGLYHSEKVVGEALRHIDRNKIILSTKCGLEWRHETPVIHKVVDGVTVYRDLSAKSIIETVKKTGSKVSGPVPMPTKKEVVTILRAVHKYKDSREQFEQRTHKRLIDIITPTQKTVDALSRLEMPAGVYIDIKMKQK